MTALISPAYLHEQRLLHAAPKGYGGKGGKWAPVVLDLIDACGAYSVLDYGCGQGSLKSALHAERPELFIHEYDPAIPGKDAAPLRAGIVVSTDVLEHIEPDRLDEVLNHLFSLAIRVLFVVIATRPASKTLSDGRNAHLTVKSGDWWRARMHRDDFKYSPGPLRPNSTKPSREWSAIFTRQR